MHRQTLNFISASPAIRSRRRFWVINIGQVQRLMQMPASGLRWVPQQLVMLWSRSAAEAKHENCPTVVPTYFEMEASMASTGLKTKSGFPVGAPVRLLP